MRMLARTWNALGDFVNVPIYKRGKFEFVRLDIALALMGIGIVLYYLTFSSWQMAVMGALSYVMVLMIALWII